MGFFLIIFLIVFNLVLNNISIPEVSQSLQDRNQYFHTPRESVVKLISVLNYQFPVNLGVTISVIICRKEGGYFIPKTQTNRTHIIVFSNVYMSTHCIINTVSELSRKDNRRTSSELRETRGSFIENIR